MLNAKQTIVITMLTVVGLSAADNSIGTWKRNEGESKGTGNCFSTYR